MAVEITYYFHIAKSSDIVLDLWAAFDIVDHIVSYFGNILLHFQDTIHHNHNQHLDAIITFFILGVGAAFSDY